MKLYATITSERATKGQGGNHLEINITGEKKNLLGVIKVFPADKSNQYGLISYNWLVGTAEGWQVKSEGIMEANDTEVSDTRAKKQEGETDEYSCNCNEGGKTENHVFWSKNDYKERGNPVCPYCDDDMYVI